jgi:hypothetical protein
MMVPPRAAPKSVPLSGDVGAARALIDALVPASQPLRQSRIWTAQEGWPWQVPIEDCLRW